MCAPFSMFWGVNNLQKYLSGLQVSNLVRKAWSCKYFCIIVSLGGDRCSGSSSTLLSLMAACKQLVILSGDSCISR
jgi:hypothetical protein